MKTKPNPLLLFVIASIIALTFVFHGLWVYNHPCAPGYVEMPIYRTGLRGDTGTHKMHVNLHFQQVPDNTMVCVRVVGSR